MPGTTDSGNHGDDQVTNISLPFSYTLYDQTFNSVNVSSNGNAQFVTTDTAFTNVCPLPWPAHNYTIFPYWDDQRTDANSGCAAFPGGTCGVFTSVSGTAPNRIFNIEWRTVYFADVTMTANYELRLYEGHEQFDVVWARPLSATAAPRWSAEKRRSELYAILLQRLGWCDDWRAKLRATSLRESDADPHGIAKRYGYNYTRVAAQLTGALTRAIPHKLIDSSAAVFRKPVRRARHVRSLAIRLPRHYDAYTYTNNTGATQCVTVNTDYRLHRHELHLRRRLPGQL